MTSFDLSDPLFDLSDPLSPSYPEPIGVQGPGGLLKTYLKRQIKTFTTICLTELDQAFIAWGLIALVIFSMAQFSSLNWTTQAVIDAALTGAGIAGTSALTWEIASLAQLRWVVFLWAILMMFGMVLTAYGIFGGIGLILMNLCPLWLGLCAFGYGLMAVGMGSRCFSACTLVHGVAIAGLPFNPSWQFFTSGLVISLTLLFFSVVPWDMRTAEADEPC